MATREVTSLSLGGGWQSTALALLLDAGELEGYARPDVAVFADTKAEPPWVYETLDALEGLLSYPVVRTSYGDLDEDTWRSIRGEPTKRHPNQLPEENGMPARGFIDIPAYSPQGLFKRHCTQDYKIEAIKRAIREMFGWPITVTQYIGISLDEAVRMKDSRVKYITNVYPLVMTRRSRADCMEYMNRRWPEVTVGRSACYFCPFHSPGEWMNIADNAPGLFEKACLMDEALAAMPSGPYGLVRHGTLRGQMEEMRMQGKMDLGPGLQDAHGDECEGFCLV